MSDWQEGHAGEQIEGFTPRMMWRDEAAGLQPLTYTYPPDEFVWERAEREVREMLDLRKADIKPLDGFTGVFTESLYPRVIALHIRKMMEAEGALRDILLIRLLASNPWWLHTVARRTGWRRMVDQAKRPGAGRPRKKQDRA